MDYFIGLGSNLGNRETNLRICRGKLPECGCRIIRKSSIFLSEPWQVLKQPWFLNQVLEITSPMQPHALLLCLEELERNMGRKEKNTLHPRLIDIDILLAGCQVIKDKSLRVPHPRIAERRFILEPWREIAANSFHPVKNKTIEELWRECGDKSAVYLYRSLAEIEEQEGVKQQ